MSKEQNLENKEKALHIGCVTNCLFGINTVLHTKDGRKIGNAIIIGKDDKYNIVKTDYGNECKFTDEEIKECFYVAYSQLTDEEKEYMRETIDEHKHSV
jgi:hypothetical protein